MHADFAVLVARVGLGVLFVAHGAAAIVLAVVGAGRLSVDHALTTRLRAARRPQPTRA